MKAPNLLAALSVVVLTSCAYGDPGPYRPPGIEDGQQHDGRGLYLRDCAFCHGPNGGGTGNGPDLVSGRNGPALTDFMLRTGRMPIDRPSERLAPGPVYLSERDIDAIVDHVASFGGEGPDIPEDIEGGDASHGMELYQSNCAACHSTTGIGGTLTAGARGDVSGDVARRGGIIAPSLLASSPVEIAEAVRTGPGTMPPYAEEIFSRDDLAAIVAYVETLQSDVDRGGAWRAGRVGPVAEGAIALFGGLLGLVLFTRWIGGTRS